MKPQYCGVRTQNTKKSILKKPKISWSPRTTVGQKNLARLRELINKGVSTADIAAKFKCSEDVIRRTCSDYKIYRRKFTAALNDERQKANERGYDIGSMIAKQEGKTIQYSSEFHLPSYDELQQYFPDRLDEFADKYVYWGGRPIVLDDKQREVLNCQDPLELWNKSAGVGLSWAFALRAAIRSIFIPGLVSIFVSVKEARAKELLNNYVYEFYQSPVFTGVIMKPNELDCTLMNGSRIHSATSAPSSVRGIPQQDSVEIYLDELAHYTQPKDRLMWEALTRRLPLGSKSMVRIWSTPYVSQGTYYDLWNEAQDETQFHNGFVPKIYNWRDCPRLTEAKVMAYKKTVGERAFNQEMENRFTAIGEEIFDQEAVDEAEMVGLSTEIQFPDSIVYGGVDFAMGGKDKMAVSVIEYDTVGKLFYTRFIKEYGAKTLNNERVESIIRTVLSNYPQISRIFGDQTAMGIPIIAHLKRKFPSMIVGVPFSREKKEDMLLNMVSIYHDARIKNPKHRKLKEQLAGISTAISNSGQLVYKHRSGGHDDLVWAQALACSAIKQGSAGIFATSFGSVGMIGEDIGMEQPTQRKTTAEIFQERVMREVMEEDGLTEDFTI